MHQWLACWALNPLYRPAYGPSENGIRRDAPDSHHYSTCRSSAPKDEKRCGMVTDLTPDDRALVLEGKRLSRGWTLSRSDAIHVTKCRHEHIMDD
jgi:hypothetical protein